LLSTDRDSPYGTLQASKNRNRKCEKESKIIEDEIAVNGFRE